MSRGEKIAVIIVNFNSGAILDKCLTAMEKQTHPADQIVVVDNCSRDGSAEDLEVRHPAVKLIRAGKNLGFAAANNLGVDAADRCTWIALLNPDAFPEPMWLENFLRGAREHADYSFFGCLLLKAYDPSVLDGTGDIYHVSGMAWRGGHGAPAESRPRTAREIFSPCGAAALYRREDWIEAGGLDEDFFCYSEDTDLSFRLRLMGHRCLFIPDAVVRHVGSATTGRRSDFSVYHGHRNLVWTYFKNMPLPLLWFYLPEHILFNLASLFWISLRGQMGVVFRAKWDALRGLPAILRKRGAIQARRRVSLMEIRRTMDTGLPAWRFSRDFLKRHGK